MDLFSWILLFASAMIWSLSFLIFKILLVNFEPETLVFYRIIFGFMAIVIIRALWKQPSFNTHNFYYWIALAICNTVIPFYFIANAMHYVDTGTASIFNAFTPFSALILAHFFTYDEKIKVRKLLGLLIATIGIIIVANVTYFSLANNNLMGGILILIACFFYGVSAIIVRKMPYDTPVNTTFMMLLCGSIMLAPFGTSSSDFVKLFNIEIFLSYFVIGSLGTGSVFVLFYLLVKRAGATNATLTTLATPAFTMLLGTFILYEPFEFTDFLGMSLIGMGILLVNGKIISKIHT